MDKRDEKKCKTAVPGPGYENKKAEKSSTKMARRPCRNSAPVLLLKVDPTLDKDVRS